MKAKDLIAKLQQMDPEQNVTVAVKTTTQVYPQAYVAPWEVETGSGRIYVTLDKGQSIRTLKVK